jgi:uncharacterized SAM-binding protein YcdF (DUF218 family)
MGLLLKNVLSLFVRPLPVAVLCIGVGLALLWFTRRQRPGKILTTIGLGVLLVFGSRHVAHGLLVPLESEYETLYPQEKLEAATLRAGRRPRWVVVLGSGHGPNPRLPPTSQLSASSLARLVEGIRLYRALPGTKLMLSGAAGQFDKHGDVMAAAARSLGVPATDIVVDTSAWDTHDEARALSARVGTDDFIVVTSGQHMPRATRLFERAGGRAIAGPTEQARLRRPESHWGDFVPNPGALDTSERALHEYIGMAWSLLRGQI